MAIAAVVVLLITTGNVSVLVVLYSINVFLTFSLSLAGLIRYWLRHREDARHHPVRGGTSRVSTISTR